MPLVFKTAPDHASDVTLVGIGVLPAHGRGGIPVATAAELGMSELQQKDQHGVLVLDDGGQPQRLEGAKLAAAARDFCERHPYVQLATVKEAEVEKVVADTGRPQDEYPSAQAAAEEAYTYAYGGGLPDVNTSGEAMATAEAATPSVGTPAEPAPPEGGGS